VRKTPTLALVLLAFSVAAADDKADKDKPAPAKTKAAPDAIPGYKKRTVEGFTVLVSNEALGQDVSKYERKPLEVLELELKTIRSVLFPRAVKVLQQGLLVWVEWDEKLEGKPNVVALYYGGSQAALLKEGKHPLKAKSVEVLTLKRLTDLRQPGSKLQQCVLLHEIAHAVHDQVLSSENLHVKAAYQQAVERKLYDDAENAYGERGRAYARTSEHEYFAELSCSYLDRGFFFPFTRDELKKHDAAGYKLMEAAWGKPYQQHLAEREKTTEKDRPKPPATGEEKTAPTVVTPEDREETAARRLKQYKELIEAGKVDRAIERLQELRKTYRGTRAAEEAAVLLEKLKE
jgi:hypothetical protein